MIAGTLIVGIGNRYRGDDALGCLMADDLRHVARGAAEIIEHDGEPASLIDCWQGRQCVVLIDAVSSAAEAGAIYRIDLGKQGLPDRFRSFSTHAFGIAESVELARVLGKLPPRIVFYGVEGKSFAADTKLSAPVQRAFETLRQEIIDEIGKEKEDA